MSSRVATEGHWWVGGQWVAGRCVHDTTVQSLHPLSAASKAVKGRPLLPRFVPAPVDLHVHGGGGHDSMAGQEAMRATLRCHARHGTGGLLLTSVTAPAEAIERFLVDAKAVMNAPRPGEATALGVHLEGPYINPQRLGAQPPHTCAIELPRLERWLDSGVVRVITFAPELAGSEALQSLCARFEVRAQIGHTDCHWSVAQRALRAGCGVTHLYNAMSGVSHRQAGAATAALASADYAEIITDGVHVEQVAFEAARRAIPNLYSVTDATAASGMPDGEYQLGSLKVVKCGDAVRLPDGTLAGSCLTQCASLDVLRGWGLSWEAIAELTSARPARWIGQSHVGRIGPGALAHWLEIHEDKCVACWIAGHRQAFADRVAVTDTSGDSSADTTGPPDSRVMSD